jgi:CRISPR/Cas system-associated protein Cas10 (large subunit of type III CRISPR-Cas system)
MDSSPDDVPDSLRTWLAKRESRALGEKKSRKTYQLKRTRLKPISAKQRKRNKEYKQATLAHYEQEANQVCAICGRSDNLSIHHSEGRGSKTSDKSTFISLCIIGTAFNKLYPELNSNGGLGCHQGVEANKAWARQQGYIK